MQNKGAIRLLIFALILVTVYQLSFTFFALKAKNDAQDYGNGDYSKEVAYLDSMKNVEVYNLLIKNYTLKDCQDRQLNLGLDLQGGMNVILQVSVPNLVRELSYNTGDPTFNAAFTAANKEYKKGKGDFLTLLAQQYKDETPNALAAIFSTSPNMPDLVKSDFTNDQVIQVLREQTDAAIDNAFNVLRTRIDRFGVTQPNIQQLENQDGRILVELPGVKDEDRVRGLLQRSASLEFFLTYNVTEIWDILQQVDVQLATILKRDDVNDIPVDTNLIAQDTIDIDTTGPSLLTDIDTNNTMINDTTALSMDDNIDQHPLIGRIYPNADPNTNELYQSPLVGYVKMTDTAEINKLLAMPEVRQLLPRDLRLAWSFESITTDNGDIIFELIALKTEKDGTAQLDGDVITNARHNFDQTKGTAEVTMIMNASAAKQWAELTGQNLQKSIAIVLDGEVYSYPTVQSKITGGVSQITGRFSIEEAQDLANVLKSGKLPVVINIVELNHVGPSLGKESITSGMLSFLIAFLVVLVYMVLYYNKAGWVSDIALVANMFFIIGVLASLGAVLTLPGIAGIVLTIGMSVDANVIIYDRIREELRAGKGVKKAITDGYANAYSAIIDANVTTLLTGIILYIFGHGPIQGFATTLIIGIFTSLFSAIFITRIIFERFLSKNKEIKFSSKWSENILSNPKFNFLSKRKTWYVVSGVVILLSIGSFAIRGLDLGVDFVGGRTYIIRFDEDKSINTTELTDYLYEEFGSSPEVKTFGSDNQVKITTKYEIESEDPNIEDVIIEKMYTALAPVLNADVDLETFKDNYIMSSQKVGPTIASDIKRAAAYSVIFALLVIFLYIFIRFKNWQFGLGATVALVHDSIITLGIFSIFWGILPFSLEIDQAFIAAILTVVGYSVNDTVIIFDRIREFFNLHPKRDKEDTINSALNSTLSRTLNTSLTTFFVLLTIFIFGGTVIRGFVFALMVGVVVGTYSSLFIASPITFDTLRRNALKEEKVKKIEQENEKVITQANIIKETEEERAERLKKEERKKA